jgi:hypothetical protein
MKRRFSKHNHAILSAVAGVGLAFAGCRHPDLNRELVEREMRLQEDELYRAHDEIADRERRLETARRENAVLKRELEAARSGAAVPPGIMPEMPPAPTGEPPRRSPREDVVPPADLTPPTIEIPGTNSPAAQAPPRESTSRPPSWRQSRDVRPASFEEEALDDRADHADDDRAAKIVFNHRLTGGYNADGRLGDEGILVVVEPRSARGRLVQPAGEISIALVDPALTGQKARVGRWDFKPDEVERLVNTSRPGAGLQFELPWRNPPKHERLMLFVRYTTADGERFEANHSILIDLADDDPDDAHRPGGQASEDTEPRDWAPDR